eukprot:TRINITY_DN3888_c0_g1_i1.p1 TRINITY_DN3888_c0_g1~~TRINITY_DN3888_c0_g1_i1.p1  ORF type:complete len:181 (+),score=80.73 TRINITY_DN3888_c0_g1_i1:2-544(+)
MQRGSLSDVLNSSKTSNLIDNILATRIAIDVVRGMCFLHINDILHRDLKSKNILLDINWTAKVCDFGISKELASYDNQMTVMQGTIAWMAPEILEHSPYNQSSDVYSFAIVLWELISKQKPYEEFNFEFNHEIIEIVKQGIRPTITDNCPLLFKQLMIQCWNANAIERPTFEQILQQLTQ